MKLEWNPHVKRLCMAWIRKEKDDKKSNGRKWENGSLRWQTKVKRWQKIWQTMSQIVDLASQRHEE